MKNAIEEQARELPPMPEAYGEITYRRTAGYIGRVEGFTRNQMRDYALAALASQPQAPAAAVPDGFVLVPRTPTDSMVGAGCMELAGSLGGYESGQVYMCWAAMLAAAPAPEVSGG